MKNKEQGITLIALAITIIVLLILAGISITSLISDNGILKQSQTAVKQNKIQEYKQELTLILLEAQLESYASSDYKIALKNYVKTKIIEAGKYNIIDEEEMEDYIIVETKTEGYKYKVTLTEVIYIEQVYRDGTGTVVANGGEGTTGVWRHTSDKVHVTNGEVTLEVGSTVNGYSANNVSNWFVLGAQNGRLLITTNTNVAQVQLSGQNGYTGGIAKLNSEAAKFTNSQYAEGTARSINVNDINRVTGYDPDVAKYNDGENTTNQWKNEVVYTKNSSDNKIYYYGTKYPTKAEGTSSGYTSFTYWTGSAWKTLDKGESSPAIKNTFYYYYPQTLSTISSSTTSINGSSSAYSLLFSNTSGSEDKFYWLATQYVCNYEDYVNFSMRYVGHCICTRSSIVRFLPVDHLVQALG